MIIKTHKVLSQFIQNKKILHSNSLGKDSVLALQWLVDYAKIKNITSLFYKFMAHHPDDDRYLNYLKKRFPSVEFVVEHDAVELSWITTGIYQSPIDVIKTYNHADYISFDRTLMTKEFFKKGEFDYICRGDSKYESFARRTKFHQKGMVFNDCIFPLAMMSKDEVIGLIEKIGLKLHPCYKFTKSTHDTISYYKMRMDMIARPEYYKRVREFYPLMELDKYRWEKLIKGKK